MVGPFAGHRLERVGDGDDPGFEGDLRRRAGPKGNPSRRSARGGGAPIPPRPAARLRPGSSARSGRGPPVPSARRRRAGSTCAGWRLRCRACPRRGGARRGEAVRADVAESPTRSPIATQIWATVSQCLRLPASFASSVRARVTARARCSGDGPAWRRSTGSTGRASRGLNTTALALVRLASYSARSAWPTIRSRPSVPIDSVSPIDTARDPNSDAGLLVEPAGDRQALDVSPAGQDDHELVAARAMDDSVVADDALDAVGDLLDAGVACDVALYVVDLLQPVEIDREDDERRAAGVSFGDRGRQRLLERALVAQPGQVVRPGLLGQLADGSIPPAPGQRDQGDERDERSQHGCDRCRAFLQPRQDPRVGDRARVGLGRRGRRRISAHLCERVPGRSSACRGARGTRPRGQGRRARRVGRCRARSAPAPRGGGPCGPLPHRRISPGRRDPVRRWSGAPGRAAPAPARCAQNSHAGRRPRGRTR